MMKEFDYQAYRNSIRGNMNTLLMQTVELLKNPTLTRRETIKLLNIKQELELMQKDFDKETIASANYGVST